MTLVVRRVAVAAGVTLVGLAIATSVILGTAGWFVVGFGVMTDCTNAYSCSGAGCSPCDTASRWITVGGVTQLALGLTGGILLVRGLRSARRGLVLPVGGLLLLAASVATMAGTTSAAQASYCRVGTPGYVASYCSTDD